MPTQIDILKMKKLVQELYVPMVYDAHGDPGLEALTELLDFLQEFYKLVSPESRRGRLTIIKRLNDTPLESLVEALSIRHMPQLSPAAVIIQISSSGRVFYSQLAAIEPEILAADAVVYTLEGQIEKFYAKNQSRIVVNPLPGAASVFATPTFSDLRSALEDYKVRQARRCTCDILQKAWKNQKRLFFRAAPEKLLQHSLARYLDQVLRDVEVRREQKVTPSRPIDIKVTWYLTNRLALIEIKWLGASKGAGGKLKRYSNARAVEGAQQLVDYLDGNAPQSPMQETKGYLVVIDGRRASLRPGLKAISYQDGFKYANVELVFPKKQYEIRNDFEAPIRMFIEPIYGQ